MSHPSPSAPSPTTAAPARRLEWWHLLLGAVVVAAATLLFLHRPAGQFFFPKCTFHELTGLLCPGCGGLRSVHELLHGHVLQAARCNLFVVAGPPLAAGWWLWRRRQGREVQPSGRVVWILFALLAVFTVLRNLPGPAFRWLAP